MRINGIYVSKHELREAFRTPEKFEEFIRELTEKYAERGSYGYSNNNKRC